MKTAKEWMLELDIEDKAHREWRERANKVIERYEDEQDREDNRFNILWSNTEVMHSALYAKTPTPEVRRRYLDKDKSGKQAAEITERAIAYCIDVYDFDAMADEAIDDYLLAGIGIVRMRYEPFFEKKDGDPVYLDQRETGFDSVKMESMYGMFNGEELVEDYQTDDEGYAYIPGEPIEDLVYEEVTSEAVNWRRFRWQPSARWEAVDWCAIEHYMTMEEIKESYPEDWRHIPLGFTAEGDKVTGDDEHARARIFEIFDKKKRLHLEIADGYDEILSKTEDPMGLEGFYPFPKPLLSTTENGKLVPIPDFLFYQDQAKELDRVSDRINVLTEELKYRGVYDATFKELARLESASDGEFIPVDDFSMLMNSGAQGDLRKVMATVPLEDLIRTLASLYESREQIKQTIYEITGIADIMRGATKASETLGAQQLKTQFGSMRLAKRQRKVAAFMRDIIRLKAEIMVENFDPKTLSMMTGIEFSDEVYQILTNDLMRSFRIDIETDSTIAEDAAQEKQNRIELVTAVSGFMEKVGPMVQAGMMPPNVASELLGFAVRGFKVGRTLEDTLDEMSQSEDDPKMRQMQEMMKQKVGEIEQQAQAYAQQVQQDAQKQIEQSEKKAFEAQKQLAIAKATDQASVVAHKIKGELTLEAQKDKVALEAQIQMFKAQLEAIQRIPQEQNESINALGQMLEATAGLIQQQASNSEMQTLELQNQMKALNTVVETLQKPVTVQRDKNGRVTGASR